MSKYSYFNIIHSILLMIILQLSQNYLVHAQKPPDPEEAYSNLRGLALDGKLTEAEEAAIALLNDYPGYGDAWILLARIYGWQQKYEAAAEILDSIILHDSDNMDALMARFDLACWRDEQSLAVEIADLLLSDPNNNEIHRKHESVILAMENQKITDTDLSISSDSIPQSVTTEEKSDTEKDYHKTDLRTGYYFDSFKEPYSRLWQVLQIGAGRDLSFGKVLAGINAGKLYSGADPAKNATEFQFEAEVYPKISQNNYAWLSYAYSPGKYFPSHRIFTEYWHNLAGNWVASIGLNYYYFNRNIFIMSLSSEKYYYSYWFSPRIYFYFKDQGTTTSFYINARKYINDTDYFQLTGGTGTASDEPFDIEIALERLSASTIKLAYYTRLTSIISLRTGIGYSREEYTESIQRNRIDGSINFIFLLNKRK